MTLCAAIFIKYNKLFRKHLVISVLMFVVITSFVPEYFECLSELEALRMMWLMTKYDPCTKYFNENRITSFIFGSSKNECLEYLKITQSSYAQLCPSTNIIGRLVAGFSIATIEKIYKGSNQIISDENIFYRGILRIVFFVIVVVISLIIVFSIKAIIKKESKEASSTSSPKSLKKKGWKLPIRHQNWYKQIKSSFLNEVAPKIKWN